jgi:hypothetical protein
MFYRITNSVKKLIIQELQELFNDHPIFGNGNLVITNKYQFEERPKYALVIKTANADSIKLGLDNFKGIVQSYTTLANLKNVPGRMIEWVKEDIKNIKNVVKPGFYVVEMVESDKFTVEPYLTVADEMLQIENFGELKRAILLHKNLNFGSEFLVAETAVPLKRDEHYTIDYQKGEIIFLKSIDDFGEITVDYQYIGQKTGPFDVQSETANLTAIPGVILAFGNFLSKGGIQVVIVYPSRQEVAKSFLGQWKLTLNLSAVAQDTDTQEQLVDLASMYLWSILQDKLIEDGIYIENFNISGETEEDEVKTSNELSFLADFSFDVHVEWEACQPILGVVKKIFLNRIEDHGQYDNTEYEVRRTRTMNSSQVGVGYSTGLQPVESLDPYVVRPAIKYLISSATNI